MDYGHSCILEKCQKLKEASFLVLFENQWLSAFYLFID